VGEQFDADFAKMVPQAPGSFDGPSRGRGSVVAPQAFVQFGFAICRRRKSQSNLREQCIVKRRSPDPPTAAILFTLCGQGKLGFLTCNTTVTLFGNHLHISLAEPELDGQMLESMQRSHRKVCSVKLFDGNHQIR
jgi:hypothetical protein